jgi:hypothetical protein
VTSASSHRKAVVKRSMQTRSSTNEKQMATQDQEDVSMVCLHQYFQEMAK